LRTSTNIEAGSSNNIQFIDSVHANFWRARTRISLCVSSIDPQPLLNSNIELIAQRETHTTLRPRSISASGHSPRLGQIFDTTTLIPILQTFSTLGGRARRVVAQSLLELDVSDYSAAAPTISRSIFGLRPGFVLVAVLQDRIDASNTIATALGIGVRSQLAAAM
jgi:hypothetical protein